MKIKYNYEMIAGGIFTVVGALLWILIPMQVKTLEKTAINAQTFPRIAIGGLFIFSLLLFIQGLFFGKKKELVISKAGFRSEAFKKEMKTVLYAFILIAYCFLIVPLGYVIASLLLVVSILAFYGTKKWWYYLIPIAMVIIIYFIFGHTLHVSLPVPKLFG